MDEKSKGEVVDDPTVPENFEEYMNFLTELEKTNPGAYKKEMGYEEEPKKRKRIRIRKWTTQ